MVRKPTRADHVDQQAGGKQCVARRAVQLRTREHERNAGEVGGGEAARHRGDGGRVEAGGIQPEYRGERAPRRVGPRVAGEMMTKTVVAEGAKRRDGCHESEERQPELEPCGFEALKVIGEAHPKPEKGGQLTEKGQQRRSGVLLFSQFVGNAGEHDHHEQVEEKLEPADRTMVSVHLVVAEERRMPEAAAGHGWRKVSPAPPGRPRKV